ncbi:MAG: hypothetical protein ABIJ45_13650 [Candidatus Zixiibacteriota bacterium]
MSDYIANDAPCHDCQTMCSVLDMTYIYAPKVHDHDQPNIIGLCQQCIVKHILPDSRKCGELGAKL